MGYIKIRKVNETNCMAKGLWMTNFKSLFLLFFLLDYVGMVELTTPTTFFVPIS